MPASLRTAAVAAALQFVLAAGAAGQAPWLGPRAGDGVSLEAVHPGLAQMDVTPSTGAYFFSLRLPLSRVLRLVGEVPYSHVGFERTSEFQDPPEGGDMIGNPYLGVEWRPEGSILSVDAGGRPPLAEYRSWRYAAMMADVNRMDAFHDVLSLAARLNLRWPVPGSHWVLAAEGGPGLWWDPDGAGEDTDVMVGWGAQVWYESRLLNVGTGITGLVHQSGEGELSERSWHQLGIAANLRVGSVRPGLVIRLPVGANMRDVLDYAIGLQLNVPGWY